MITWFVKIIFRISSMPPIKGTHKNLWKFQTQLSDDLFKVVATVGIYKDQFPNILTIQYLNDIFQNSVLRTRTHIYTKWNIHLSRIDSKRNRRQHNYFSILLPGNFGRSNGHIFCLKIIRSIGQMVVVCLRGTPWQYSNGKISILDRLPIGLC